MHTSYRLCHRKATVDYASFLPWREEGRVINHGFPTLIGFSPIYSAHLICYRSEKLDEKDLGVDKDSQETGNSRETAWPNKMEEDNISNSQSKVVTEEMEEEEEYEITEFDD